MQLTHPFSFFIIFFSTFYNYIACTRNKNNNNLKQTQTYKKYKVTSRKHCSHLKPRGNSGGAWFHAPPLTAARGLTRRRCSCAASTASSVSEEVIMYFLDVYVFILNCCYFCFLYILCNCAMYPKKYNEKREWVCELHKKNIKKKQSKQSKQKNKKMCFRAYGRIPKLFSLYFL